jgi:hypothetical protein
MALPGLVAAKNLADVSDRERAWDNLGLNLSVNLTTPESLAYIAAVEQADGAFLEEEVKQAIHAFVVGCKFDGIWPAIKASCIMAGARTRLGAMVPLVGAAPTSFVFVDGDYDRKTGLVGNGSTKYLNSNRADNADPQDDHHISCFVAAMPTVGNSFVGTGANAQTNIGSTFSRSRSNTATGLAPLANFFMGVSRTNSLNYSNRVNGATSSQPTSSDAPSSSSHGIFARISAGVPSSHSNARLSFYSIGESLDLALLDARVTTLMNAFAAAIP